MRELKRHLVVLAALGLTLSALWAHESHATVTNTTVSTTTAYGDGSTTNFAIGFDFRSNSWLVVTEYDTSTSPTTVTVVPQGIGAGKYTVSGGNPGTTIVMGTAPTNTQYLVISRSIPQTQTITFSPSSPFPYSGLSSQLDQITLWLQNLQASGTGGGGGGGGGGGTAIPSGVGYNLLGWNSDGSALTNYGGGSLVNGDILQFNGSSWVPYLLNSSGLISTINSGSTPMNPAVGGTGVSNNGLLTWGTHALTFTLSGDTTLTLPTSGTVVTGTVDTANTTNTIVKRDGSGNISVNQITGNLVGNVAGNVTGSLTGSASGTSANVTGTVAIGHGGTGATTQQAAINALTGTQTNHYFLKSDGTNSALNPIVTGDLPQNIPWSNMAQQTHNSLLWSDGSGNEGVIPTNVNSGYVLISDGVKPYWGPVGSGVPGIFPYGTDSGSANAYVVATPNPPVPILAPGIGVSFIALSTNTGASTLDVSSIGATSIVHADGSALVAGDIVGGQMVVVEYDGTHFQLVNPNLPSSPTVLTVTTDASPTASQNDIVVDCGVDCTITLPAISGLPKPTHFTVKNVATTNVTVAPTGLDTIDGGASAVLNFQYQGITLVPTSSGWLIQ